MQSHRRPRGKIFFESFCAVCVGVSFVGAWTQTGAWAFLAPAFICTLFGLYWALDMFGSDKPAVAAARADLAVPSAAPDPEPVPAEEIRFERFEPPIAELEPVAFVGSEPAIAEPTTPAKPKRRAKKLAKASEPAAEQIACEPEPEPFHQEPHIEQLFDPQPFARQARPAFGKRPRGPGPRPLPA